MKNMRKIASLLLALVMFFSLAISASAATVENKTSHPYKAYQIFSGTQAEGSSALGDVEWGTGINGATFLNALKGDDRFKKDEVNIFASCTTAMDVAKALADNTSYASAFANVATANLKTDATPVEIAANVTSADLSAGYYLLVDSSTDVSNHDAKNSALLQVTNEGKIVIDKKYSVPSPDKGITAVTPKVGTKVTFTGAEAVDAEIGDTIEFTLYGTLPSNYDDYETYVYKFHDTMSANLTYQSDAKVYVVNGETSTEITSSFTISTSCDVSSCSCNLLISCANLKQVSGVTSTSKIKVVYSAKLASNATIGETGNPNEMYIEYSNNPNQTGSGETSHTPKDEVVVFTYELDVTKIDGKTPADGGTAPKLSGAEFVLLNSDKTKVAKVADGVLTEWFDVPTAGEGGTITWPDGTKLTSGEDGKFIIKGLDSGTYNLREIKAPAGYNLLTMDVVIVITATITPADGTEGEAALTALKIKVDDGAEVDGAKDDGKYTGVLSTDVKNNQGGTLPETGGVGTTMFYVIGSILVLAAVVLLVTKKRMGSAE